MLAQRLTFSPERDAEILDAIPAQPAVFLVRPPGPTAEPYVSKTANLKRRLTRLLAAPEGAGKKLTLRRQAAEIEYALTGSDFESGLLLYRVLRRLFPARYRAKLRLDFPALVRIQWDNAYPRAFVTRRLSRREGNSLYYGPFPSRASAERFLNDALDLFKSRRCTFELHPDPAFPGCVYSEMKMCLAPCFKGCSDEEYMAEVRRMQAFLDTGGQSLRRELEAQRESASSALEFESAATIHGRIEKAAAAAALAPEFVRRLDRWRGLIVQPSAQDGAVALFRIERGQLLDPIPFVVQPQHARDPGPPTPGSPTPGSPTHPGFGCGGVEARPGFGCGGVGARTGFVRGGVEGDLPPREKSELRGAESMESRVIAALEAAPAAPRASAAEIMEHLAILRRWLYRRWKVGEVFLADDRGELPLRRIVRGISRVFRGERLAEEIRSSGDRVIG